MAEKKPKLVWKPKKVTDKIIQRVRLGVVEGANHARNKIVEALSRTQPVQTSESGRRRGLDPSKPWTAPKMVDGDYRRSISVRRQISRRAAQASIHSNDHKAARLEFGFVGKDKLGKQINQEPRPAIRATLLKERSAIIKIINRGIR